MGYRQTPPRFPAPWIASSNAKRFHQAQTPEAPGLSDIVFDPTNIEEMEKRLEELRARHRELDDTIAQLKLEGGEEIRVMGLKREKLRLKDRITWLSSKLTPDIIA